MIESVGTSFEFAKNSIGALLLTVYCMLHGLHSLLPVVTFNPVFSI
jgi:hypothetical protein